MASERVRRRIVVQGHVQGVFFRDTAREHAEASGATGWVRNRPDGSVEAELEGTPDAVEQVTRFFKEGPSRAEVSDIEVSEQPEPEGSKRFEVR